MRSIFSSVALTLLGGCALLWGFEERTLERDTSAGGNGTSSSSSSSSTTGGNGGTPTTGGGGSGETGGDGGAPSIDVLLVADGDKNAVGIYDPFDGHYLGTDLIPPFQGTEAYTFSFVYHAAQGPDGRIYVVDPIEAAVLAFHPSGEFDEIFVEDLVGVTSVAFRDGDVFVSVKVTETSVVARFDVSGQRLDDFIANGSPDEIRPEHIHFLPNKTMLMSHTGTPEQIRRYDVSGPPFNFVFTPDFATQVVSDSAGGILTAELGAYRSHSSAGVEQVSVAASVAGGIWELGNGHWLATDADGVVEVDPVAMEVIEEIRVGTGYWKIGSATLPALPE